MDRYMFKKKYNLFENTNISVLFRSFIIIDKASEKKSNICTFK